MRIRRGVAVLTAVLVASFAACGTNPNDAEAHRTPKSTTDAETRSSSTPLAASTTTGPTGSSASEQLADFVAAARTLDAQLNEAAEQINATGPPWPTVRPSVTAAVLAADPRRLDGTFPQGMPLPLFQKALVVYSELLSRRYAMTDFAFPQELPPEYAAQHQGEMLNALANGHEAARRFPADVVALERAADQAPAFEPEPVRSRAGAELALILELVRGVENCSDSRGGTIFDEVPFIEWTPGEASGRPTDGLINGGPFAARLVGGSWRIDLFAC